MTEIERVREVVKWLIFKGYAESEKDIATNLGYTASSFSQLLNGRVPLSKKFIKKLASANENINELWILGGNGTMLLTDPSSEPTTISPKKVELSELDVLRAKIEKLEAKIDEKDEQIGVLIRNLDKLTEKNSNEAVKEKEGSRNVKESAKGV